MQRGAFAHPEFDAYAPQVDVFCDEEVRSCWFRVSLYVGRCVGGIEERGSDLEACASVCRRRLCRHVAGARSDRTRPTTPHHPNDDGRPSLMPTTPTSHRPTAH